MTSPPRLTSSPLPLQTRRFCAARETFTYKPCNVSCRLSVRPYPDPIAEVHGRTLRLRDQFLQEASRDGYYASRGDIFSGTSWEAQQLKKVTVPLYLRHPLSTPPQKSSSAVAMDALHCPQPSPQPSQPSPESEVEAEPHLGPKQTIPVRLMKPFNGKIKGCIAVWGDQWVLKRRKDAAFQPPSRNPRQPPPRNPRQPPPAARRGQVVEHQRSSTPILLVSCPTVQTASPAHQGHVNTAHPVPIPTAQRRLPVDRFSTSIAPHGGHGPPTSVNHPPPLTSEYEVLRTRSAHSWQHPGGVQHSAPPYPVSQPVIGDPRVQYANEIQHGAPPYPVPQPIVGDPRVQYATAQASYAQPNAALPTANPYGVDSGAQQGTYVPTVSAQHAYNHAVMEAPDAPLWVQTATDDLLYQDESTTIYRSTVPAGQWGANVHQPLPAQAGQRSVDAYHPNPTQARQTRRSMHAHHPYPAQARQMRMSAHHPYPAQARQRTVNAYHPSPVQVGQWSEDVYHPVPVQAGHMPMDAYHPAPVQAGHMEAYQPYPAQVDYPAAGPSHANWGAGVASSSTAQFPYFEV